MTPRGAGALRGVGLAALWLLPARAPALDRWERAADPRAAEARDHVTAAEDLLRSARRASLEARLMGDPAPDVGNVLRRVLDQYSRALEGTPDDVPTLLAAASLTEQLDDHAAAESLIDRALALAPAGPDTPSLLFELALVHTRLNHFADARDDYLRELAFPLDDHDQTTVLGNLADTYVSLMDLPAAEDAYERCVSVGPWYDLGWLGLAVTYDRDGRAEASGNARRALEAPHPSGRTLFTSIDSPGVFFVPDYDRHYYVGMAWEAVADTLDRSDFMGEQRVQIARQNALAAWQMYLREAPATDPWRARVLSHVTTLAPSGGPPAVPPGAHPDHPRSTHPR